MTTTDQPIWTMLEHLDANIVDYPTPENIAMQRQYLAQLRTHLSNQPPVDEAIRTVKEALEEILRLSGAPQAGAAGYVYDEAAEALSSLPAIEAALNKPKVSLERCTQAILISGQCPTMIYNFAENCARTVLNAAEVDYE